MKVKKAIIPAAGLGTRFLPATKSMPKEMMPIVDKPVIQFIVEEAVASGIEDILIITGKNKRAIEDHFDKSYELEEILKKRNKAGLLEQIEQISNLANIHYIRQKEPRGLGDAVMQARSFIGDEPFALMLGDDIVETQDGEDPCILQLIRAYEKHHTSIIGTMTVSEQDVDRYGIVLTSEDVIKPGELLQVEDLIEKPAPFETHSRIAIMGRYILEPDVFQYLRETRPGIGDEIQLTDALKQLNRVKSMKAIGTKGARFDVGTPLGFLQVNLAFAMKNPLYSSELETILEQILKEYKNDGSLEAME
ncbi:MAG: UTP--glucose-1-phosphate uridylyltransferase GalU [Bacillaceae bacterium]|nr:UTP--glucose-1-phosphate uridylyltransferase GalU [Bacillaceae bacterium]